MSEHLEPMMTGVSVPDLFDIYLERISCVFEPNSASKFGPPKKIPLKNENVTIGRAELNSVFIPLIWISREHCIIFKDENQQWVLKCLSINDITINSESCTKGSEHLLQDNDTILFQGPKPQHVKYRFRKKQKFVIEDQDSSKDEKYPLQVSNASEILDFKTALSLELPPSPSVIIPEQNFEEEVKCENKEYGSSLSDLLKELRSVRKQIQEKEKQQILTEESRKKELAEITDIINSEKNSVMKGVIVPVVKTIKDHFSCELCQNRLEEAIILDCGHNFCNACVSLRRKTCPKCNFKFICRSKLFAADNFLKSIGDLLRPWHVGENLFELIPSATANIPTEGIQIPTLVDIAETGDMSEQREILVQH
ncbi:unnamed protein product [Allacma fusca]|uniref:E3 ubiquitin-protein ligase CHFR n=1 Tax=Allacma fusca TaxID=39272 RepID=A0A8J2PFH4_9HEXA|nr:unnamed protein product [Allacma fusca]